MLDPFQLIRIRIHQVFPLIRIRIQMVRYVTVQIRIVEEEKNTKFTTSVVNLEWFISDPATIL